MKKVLFFVLTALLTAVGTDAFAQYANGTRVEGNIKYTFGAYKNANGEKIKKADLKNYFDSYQYADYQKASKKFRSGITLTSVGLVAGGLGTAYVAIIKAENAGSDYDLTWLLGAPGYIVAAGGVICAAIGIPKLIIGNSQLNNIAKDYNNGQTVSLSLGYQQYGIGLALNF